MMQVIKDITHMLLDLYCNSVLEQHGVCKKLYELKDHLEANLQHDMQYFNKVFQYK